MKATLSQLLAAAQLAEMNYQADPASEHKREASEKAKAEYDKAANAELEANPPTAPDEPKSDVEILRAIVDELDQAYQAKQAELEKAANALLSLENENTLLKNQLIEKDQKINELQKSALSGNPLNPEGAPEVAPAPAARPLTGAAKLAVEKAAAKAAAEEEAKKNS